MQATAAGTLAPHNLNRNFDQRRDPLHISTSRVEADVLMPNAGVIGQQWAVMSGKGSPEHSFETSISKLEKVQADLTKQANEDEPIDEPLEIQALRLRAELENGTTEEANVQERELKIILIKDQGASLGPAQTGALSKEERSAVLAYEKVKEAEEESKAKFKEKNHFMRCIRPQLSDDPQLLSVELGKRSVSLAATRQNLYKAKGELSRQLTILWQHHMQTLHTDVDRKKCQEKIAEHASKMMVSHRDLDELNDQRCQIGRELQCAISHFMQTNKIDNKENIDKLYSLLKPFDELCGDYDASVERLSRGKFLRGLPLGRDLEVVLQLDPSKFRNVEDMLDAETSKILSARDNRIYGKKSRLLNADDCSRREAKQVLHLHEGEIPFETYEEIGRTCGLESHEVNYIARWRLNLNSWHYANQQPDLIGKEEMHQYAIPISRYRLDQKIQRNFDTGAGASKARDLLQGKDLEEYKVDWQCKIDKGFTPLHELFKGDRELPHLYNYYVSNMTGRLAYLPPERQRNLVNSVLFSKNCSLDEAKAKLKLGSEDVTMSYMPGIYTTLGAAVEDAEDLRNRFGLSSVVVCNNQIKGLPRGIVKGAMMELESLDESVLALRQAWSSTFEANAKGVVLHACHSNGAVITARALEEMPLEFRRRIVVVTIAAQEMIEDHHCFKAYNVFSPNDLIALRAKNMNRDQAREVMAEIGSARSSDHSRRSEFLRKTINEALALAKKDIDHLLSVI